MQREASSRNIDGIADLVVIAPIKEGFIRAYENITYATRLKTVAEALHKIRVSAREHELTTPFSDTTQRILTLLDFRIGVLDKDLLQRGGPVTEGVAPRRFLFLAATFDGAWEPYMRLIWRPLGHFLDLLFCNCEGYVTAGDHGFAEYARWVRANQVDSAIFYATSGITVKDQLYLSKLERLQRADADNDFAIATLTSDNPDAMAAAERAAALAALQHGNPAPFLKLNELALEALTVLYRLADYYPPDRLVPTVDDPDAEGRYLLRIARDLLDGWRTDLLPPAARVAFAEPLGWFESPVPIGSSQPTPDDPAYDAGEVQGGMLSAYGDAARPVTHGALLLMGIADQARAQAWLGQLGLQFEADGPPGDGCYRNLAFTPNGLARIGLPAEALRQFPKEFRDGMAERSGLLGDMRENHPRRWALPPRNWPRPAPGAPLPPPVEIDEIDVLLQLRVAPAPGEDGGTLLEAEISRLAAGAEAAGMILLGVEDMVSFHAAPGQGGTGGVVNHLGFRDGVSQPNARPGLADGTARARDDVRLGELVCGYRNDREDYADPLLAGPQGLMANGSFLVVRKTDLDTPSFDSFLGSEAARVSAALGIAFTADDLAARLMGRYRDGRPLIRPEQGVHNDFDYATDDPQGQACPFAAHVRRANPRTRFAGRPAPRIARRGMSYGPPVGSGDPAARRGLMFMCYSASIAEQYEVIQRWINGANSTDVAAAQNDPILGIAPHPGPRVFRFTVAGKVARVTLPGPFASVAWGAYFFVPSRTAIAQLCAMPPVAIDAGDPDAGDARLAALAALGEAAPDEWKRLLEDFDAKDPDELAQSPAIWAAIRDRHGGAYRIAGGIGHYGDAAPPPGNPPQPVVLVASPAHIMTVLSNWQIFSVEEQLSRITSSMRAIYVAAQPDDRYGNPALSSHYAAESAATNAILLGCRKEDAFTAGFAVGRQLLDTAKQVATALGAPYVEMELRRQFLMPALGLLCRQWFGLPDMTNVMLGGWNWNAGDTMPRCPGDFLSPSRDAFYPRPTPTVSAYAKRHGQAIMAAGRQFVARQRAAGTPAGTVSTAMFAAIADDDVLARNIVGIMVGALPPMDGCLRGVVYDWLHDKTLWRHQAALRRAAGTGTLDPASALSALEPAVATSICKRPAPDLIYRTALADYVLPAGPGAPQGVAIKAGDLVVLGLVSATQSTGDISAVFGGDRSQATHPPHACPAHQMAMGGMTGILAALLDSGRIQSLPASLIVRISDWARQ